MDMLYSVGSSLPEYRVKAINNSSDSRNLIHKDEYAQRYGFRAGLVPGVSIYAYMSRSLIDFIGRSWLERGSADIRFVHPIYEGEEVRISGCLTSVKKNGTLCIDYQACNNQGVICAVGTAQLPPEPPKSEPSLNDYPAGEGKLHRPISLQSLNVGDWLTPVTSEYTWNVHWQYCQKSIRDHHPLYQKILHPGWLLNQANIILATNYALSAWIHVSSNVQNYHIQEEEGIVETRGRIQGKFERSGNHFIVMDLAIFAAGHCIETIRHTAIFYIAPKAA